MDITLANDSNEVINQLLNVVLPLAVALLSIVVTALLGSASWKAIQKFVGDLRGLVDEPTDPVVIAIEGVAEFVLDRDLDRQLISDLTTAVIDAVSNGE